MEAERDSDGRDRACGDVDSVEHDEIGAVLGSPADDRDQPAVAFGGVRGSRDEQRFFRRGVGPVVVVGEFTGFIVVVADAGVAGR